MSDFPPDLFAGSRFAVLGLGRNGAAVVSALLGMGAEVQAWDDKSSGSGLAAHPRLMVEPFDSLAGFDALILSPGIPHTLPTPHPVALMARELGIPILSDAELLYRAVRAAGSKARFASITGTNGKSTTTALLAHILQTAGLPAAAGGNLGNAALSLPLLPDDGVYVIEMSSYMLERLDQFHASCAVLLNLTPDHLDRHGDMAGYARAKAHVFDNMTSADLALFGTPGPEMQNVADAVAARGIQPVWLPEPVDGRIVARGATLADLSNAPALPGAHNAQNVAAAALMAVHCDAAPDSIASGIASFPGLSHRQKIVARHRGVTFIDDSKATNADAAERALSCYDRIIWIAGGMAKSGGIAPLAPYFPRIAHALLIGRDAPMLAETLVAHGVAHTVVGTLEAAVPEADRLARALDAPVVLLSPACASFDQFSSFEERGSRFLHHVDNLIETDGSEISLDTPTHKAPP
jgi:UDP-N-acetylmuramoylalanine--D-glutamate ligase